MTPFIDIHCHPALKNYLFDHSIFQEAEGTPDNNYANIQVTVPAMEKAGVNAVMSAYYLPEKYILTDWSAARLASEFFRRKIEKYKEKVEKEDAYAQTIDMMDTFAKLFEGKTNVVLAKTFSELNGAIETAKVFIQTLEGAHHLGRELPLEEYKLRIDNFKKKGIAMITISHFYPNDITTPCEGIPPLSKHMLGMGYIPKYSVPMKEQGIAIVTHLLDAGILVDLTHTNLGARQQIYQINRQRSNKKRPLVFSHVGVNHFFSDAQNSSFGEMGPQDWEIDEIADCDGVIGVIFMNYWLTGKEDHLFSPRDSGFEMIFDTIKYISERTKSFRHIAIGTDFDGMSDPTDDFYDTGMLGEFKAKLLSRKADLKATEDDINNILGGNIMRVLKNSGF